MRYAITPYSKEEKRIGMKKIKVIFEEDPTLDNIEITIRAKENDEQTKAISARLTKEKPDTMSGTDGDGNVCIFDINDIISISASGKKANIITVSNKYTARSPLNEMEKRLTDGRFVRISRYEIVNLDKISKYNFTLGGTLRLELSGGIETWASRRNIPLIRKKLTERE